MAVAEERNSSFLTTLDFSAAYDTAEQPYLLCTSPALQSNGSLPTSLMAQPQAQGLAHSRLLINIFI